MEDLKCDTVFALSVIENKQKGSIFADNPAKPSCAMIVHYCSGYALIVGQPDNRKFNQDIINRINSKKIATRRRHLRLIVPNDAWEKVFCSSYYDHWSAVHTRLKFRFNQQKFDASRAAMPSLPDKYKITPITKDLFKKIKGTVVPQVYWENPDNFMTNGVGFALMDNSYIISTAFSAYIYNSMIDIGVETAKGYRGQNFAYFTAMEMIDHCLKHRYEPIWGTRNDNISSIMLAEKLGFEKVAEFPIIFISLKK